MQWLLANSGSCIRVPVHWKQQCDLHRFWILLHESELCLQRWSQASGWGNATWRATSPTPAPAPPCPSSLWPIHLHPPSVLSPLSCFQGNLHHVPPFVNLFSSGFASTTFPVVPPSPTGSSAQSTNDCCSTPGSLETAVATISTERQRRQTNHLRQSPSQCRETSFDETGWFCR